MDNLVFIAILAEKLPPAQRDRARITGLTLVVIELVLGIDNLVFIAILAEKLPPAQRDRARITGL
ncbi:hypothetical protein CKQ79_29945, partial [Klebsiella pneumoniae]